ncbi:hypothetical protein KM043_011300 [Ampulex compressa]|nr:hypothetical protein KM043_011300 [Ampulex compressa]
MMERREDASFVRYEIWKSRGQGNEGNIRHVMLKEKVGTSKWFQRLDWARRLPNAEENVAVGTRRVEVKKNGYVDRGEEKKGYLRLIREVKYRHLPILLRQRGRSQCTLHGAGITRDCHERRHNHVEFPMFSRARTTRIIPKTGSYKYFGNL